jgi:hypothetical protein
MRRFGFGGILRRYSQSFYLIRTPEVTWVDGEAVHADPVRVPMRGSIQPVGTTLQQLESGRYTMDDRVIYTTSKLLEGDVIEYLGKQYTIDGGDPREYSDVQKYMAKLVSSHDPVAEDS